MPVNIPNNMDGKNSEYHTKPKLLEQVKRAMRTRNYSPRTITTYVQWIKRFILFHNKTHPDDMVKEEVSSLLLSVVFLGAPMSR